MRKYGIHNAHRHNSACNYTSTKLYLIISHLVIKSALLYMYVYILIHAVPELAEIVQQDLKHWK